MVEALEIRSLWALAFPCFVHVGAEVFACRQLLQDQGAGIQVNFDHCLTWDGETHRELLLLFYTYRDLWKCNVLQPSAEAVFLSNL